MSVPFSCVFVPTWKYSMIFTLHACTETGSMNEQTTGKPGEGAMESNETRFTTVQRTNCLSSQLDATNKSSVTEKRNNEFLKDNAAHRNDQKEILYWLKPASSPTIEKWPSLQKSVLVLVRSSILLPLKYSMDLFLETPAAQGIYGTMEK